MKKILAAGLLMVSLSACSTMQQGAAVGAVAGGIIGGVTTSSVAGVAVGAAVGGVAGALIGRVAGSDDLCYYRTKHGRHYRDYCPR